VICHRSEVLWGFGPIRFDPCVPDLRARTSIGFRRNGGEAGGEPGWTCRQVPRKTYSRARNLKQYLIAKGIKTKVIKNLARPNTKVLFFRAGPIGMERFRSFEVVSAKPGNCTGGE
jgi:hypothetical protein